MEHLITNAINFYLRDIRVKEFFNQSWSDHSLSFSERLNKTFVKSEFYLPRPIKAITGAQKLRITSDLKEQFTIYEFLK